MRKFNGVPKSNFPLFLKECEWRFNNPKPKSQLKHLKQRGSFEEMATVFLICHVPYEDVRSLVLTGETPHPLDSNDH